MSRKGKLRSLLAIVLTCSMILPTISAAASLETQGESVTVQQIQDENDAQTESRDSEETEEGVSEPISDTETLSNTESESDSDRTVLTQTESQEDIRKSSEAETEESTIQRAADPAVGKPLVKEATSRSQINFNREWKFIRKDEEGAQAVDFNDSEWVDIGIPHNFSIPYEMTASFYVGYGWYRKTFEVPENWNGKKVELEFEGVFQEAEIYVNGQAVGTHRGGYSGFVYDITPYLNTGTNVLAVRVNNIWQPDLAPRAGDHQFTGGIYRDVYLNVTDDVHVTWYGTFVTTPDLTNPAFDASAKNVLQSYTSEDEIRQNIEKKQSNVAVNTEIKNDSGQSQKVKVRHEVVDKNNIVVGVFESKEQEVAAGTTAKIDAVSDKISGIQLWSPENPYVYKVNTTVYSNGKVVDTYDSSFGFRWVQYKNDGFYINGVKTLLDGANVHQDHAGFADAVTNEGFMRDVAMIKESGLNFIRGSHYPHDPAFASACDQQGILFWSECNFWGMGGCAGKDDAAGMTSADWFKDAYPQNPADEAAFEQSCLESLEAMIRVNRNHPSVINWSMGNEVFFTSGGMDNGMNKGTSGTAPQALALVDKMRNLSHELDPTRKAGMGGVQRGGYDDLSVCDIAGYNGDGGKITNNKMPNVVAEYSSNVANRPGEYKPFYADIAGADQYSYKLTPNSSGLVLWCGFHHGTIGGDTLAKMGIIDYYRLPLNTWYWYRETKTGVAPEASVQGKAASMELTASDFTISNDGTKDTKLVVTMKDANGNWVDETKTVTLKVESGPGIFPGGKTYKFVPNKSIRDGKASIEFRSYYSGKTVITAAADGLPTATLTVNTEDVTGTETGREPENFYNAEKWGSVTSTIKAPTTYGGNNAASGRPSFPSSNRGDSGLAADGKIDTSWVAEKAGSNEYFMVDLEFSLFLYKLNLGFDKTPYPYKVEISMDKDKEWTTVAQYTKETISTRKEEESLDGIEARYVRVTFTDVPENEKAFLSELGVYGNPSGVTPQYTKDSVYLSDVVDFDAVITGWGSKIKDRTCEGNKISVGGTTYEKGLGLHADSVVTYNLDKKYTRFAGAAGIDGEVGSGGNAIFRIYADDKVIYEKELSGGDADEFDLSVNDISVLTLKTENNGSDSQDHTDWADARLYGAIRDVSKMGTDVKAAYVGMSDGIQAGEKFVGKLTLKNTGASERQICSSISLYNKEGKLIGYDMNNELFYPDSEKNISRSLTIPGKIEGYQAKISVWDPETMELLANTVLVYPDQDKLENGGSTSAETLWNKIDGEDSAVQKQGDWQLWPGDGSYKTTETYLGDSNNPIQEGDYIALTFTGEYIRIAAKVDGSQAGADVYIDGNKVEHINNNGSGNAYEVVYSSERLTPGEHTVKLVPTGKFGLDYFEYGAAHTSEPGVVPDTDSPILTVMGGLTTKIETGVMGQYTLKSIKSASDAMMAAYQVYVKQDAKEGEITQAAAALDQAVKTLEYRDLELEAAVLALQAVVANAKAVVDKGQGNYTKASWTNLKSAYDTANNLLGKEGVTKEELLNAAANLERAEKGLQTKADTSKLTDAVNKAKAILAKGQSNYTDDSWSKLKASYDTASKILDKDEPVKSEIDSAVNNLNTAINGLKLKPTDPVLASRKALQTEISQAQSVIKKGQQHYTSTTYKNLKSALSAAQKVLADQKSTNEKLVSAANTLKKARTGLKMYAVPKKGKSYTVGNLNYQITKSSSVSKTVAVAGARKKTSTSLSVPKTVKISSYTFKVTSINKNAFSRNTKLKSITIGNNVTTIGNNAFYKAAALTKVTVGTGLKTIGTNAFNGAKKLKTITIKSSNLKTVGKNSFKGLYAKAVVKVPKKKLSSYKKLLKNKGLSKSAKVIKD